MNKHIRFTGDFKDLKPMGYKFQKMYASNYNCWHKHTDPKGFGESIWVWQRGREVDFNSLGIYSYIVLEEVVFKNRIGYTIDRGGSDTIPVRHFILDKRNLELNDYRFEDTLMYKFALSNSISTDPTDEDCKEYHSRFQEIIIQDLFVDMIKELTDKNMIEIVGN